MFGNYPGIAVLQGGEDVKNSSCRRCSSYFVEHLEYLLL